MNSVRFRVTRVAPLLGAGLLTVCCAASIRSAYAQATDTWTGASGVDLNWTTAGNWSGGVAPNPGDTLAFPSGVTTANRTTTNDFTAGTQFSGITFTGASYTLAGNAITLTGNVSSTYAETISLNMAIAQATDLSVTAAVIVVDSGNLSGNYGITKDGVGTLRFSGTAKTYTGDTTINGGLLDIAADNMLPYGAGTGNVIVNSGATLQLNNYNLNINGLSGAGTVSKVGSNTRTLTIGNNNASSSFTGTLNQAAGTLALVKTGTGTIALNGTSNYTGTTTVSGGTLALGAINALGANGSGQGGSLTLTNGGLGNSATTAITQKMSSLTLTTGTANTLDFGAGNAGEILNFTGTTPTATTVSPFASGTGTLLVSDWTGNTTVGGGTDQLIFGTSAGLTVAQVAQISFLNPNGVAGTYAALQLANGEVVANLPASSSSPEPASASLLLMAGAGSFFGAIRLRRRG